MPLYTAERCFFFLSLWQIRYTGGPGVSLAVDDFVNSEAGRGLTGLRVACPSSVQAARDMSELLATLAYHEPLKHLSISGRFDIGSRSVLDLSRLTQLETLSLRVSSYRLHGLEYLGRLHSLVLENETQSWSTTWLSVRPCSLSIKFREWCFVTHRAAQGLPMDGALTSLSMRMFEGASRPGFLLPTTLRQLLLHDMFYGETGILSNQTALTALTAYVIIPVEREGLEIAEEFEVCGLAGLKSLSLLLHVSRGVPDPDTMASRRALYVAASCPLRTAGPLWCRCRCPSRAASAA